MKIFRLLLLLAVLIFNFSFTNALECPEKKEKSSVACSVSNFVVTPSSNLCNGELLTLNFTFTGVDFGLNGYTIMSSDGYNIFQLGDPQTFIQIALCEPNITFEIFDNDNPGCSATFNYGLVCCDCQYSIDITQSACMGDVFTAYINYQYQSGSCGNHNPTLTINGNHM